MPRRGNNELSEYQPLFAGTRRIIGAIQLFAMLYNDTEIKTKYIASGDDEMLFTAKMMGHTLSGIRHWRVLRGVTLLHHHRAMLASTPAW